MLLIIGLWWVNPLAAKDDLSVEDQLVGVMFKNLAKAYVSVSDYERLKKDTILRLKGMEDERFKACYAKSLAVISEFPQEVKIKYGINENMKRRDAIKKLGKWDKKKVCQIIDSVPEGVIAKHFKEYIRKRDPEVKKSNLLSQVKGFWGRVKGNLESK